MTGHSTFLLFGFNRHVQGRYFPMPRELRLRDGSSIRVGPSFECGRAEELRDLEHGEAVEISGFTVHSVARVLVPDDDEPGRTIIELV